MGNTIKRRPFFFFFQGSEKVARRSICRHQDSRGVPVNVLQQQICPFSKQQLLTLSAVFIQNIKIDLCVCCILVFWVVFCFFFFSASQGLERKRTDPITPPIPYFGSLLLAVKCKTQVLTSTLENRALKNRIWARASLSQYILLYQKRLSFNYWMPIRKIWQHTK